MKIAITGKMCSGKSLLAEHLCTKYKFHKFAFADKIKHLASELFQMEGKDRLLLQTLADKMKDINNDVWINYVITQINNFINDNYPCNIVIDDLRFPNELEKLKREGFYIIRLNISPEIQFERLKKKYPDNFKNHIKGLNHNSESHIDKLDVDYTIESDQNIKGNLDKILLNIINASD